MGEDARRMSAPLKIQIPGTLWPWFSDELPEHLRERFKHKTFGHGNRYVGAFLPEEARMVKMALLRTERGLLRDYGRLEFDMATRCAGIADRIEADLRVAGAA